MLITSLGINLHSRFLYFLISLSWAYKLGDLGNYRTYGCTKVHITLHFPYTRLGLYLRLTIPDQCFFLSLLATIVPVDFLEGSSGRSQLISTTSEFYLEIGTAMICDSRLSHVIVASCSPVFLLVSFTFTDAFFSHLGGKAGICVEAGRSKIPYDPT